MMKIIKTETPFAHNASNGKPKRFTRSILTRSVPVAILIVTCCAIKCVSGNTPPGVFYADDGEGSCFICMHTKVDRRCRSLQPCGHAGICRGCIDQLRATTNTCPCCQKRFTGLGESFVPTPQGEAEYDEAKHDDQHHHGRVETLGETEQKYDDAAAKNAFYQLNVPWESIRECIYCLADNKSDKSKPRSFGEMNERCTMPYCCGGKFGHLPAEMELRTYVCPCCKGQRGIIQSVLSLFRLDWLSSSCKLCNGNTTVKGQCKWPAKRKWNRIDRWRRRMAAAATFSNRAHHS